MHEIETLIQVLRERGVLKPICYCSGCGQPLAEVKFKRSIDGKAFRCYKSNCSEKMKYISIRKNSFFEDLKLPLNILIECCQKWFHNSLQSDIIRETRVSRSFCAKLFNKIRKKIDLYFRDNTYLLGGQGIICQIDESMFKYKRKYHVGHYLPEERWVFGIADTSCKPARYYVTVVPDRSARTLLPIISQRCREGSIIWSDKWSAYRRIIDLGFNHETVDHSIQFVNPITGCHTQNIESLWNKLKRRIKSIMGVKHNILQSYLNEYMWKDNIAKKDFEIFYELIKY